jgi:hypothetical protein
MQDVERRINRARSALSGNESLLEGLGDEGASVLLAWGHELAGLIYADTVELDDASAEEVTAPKMRALRTLLRRLNLCASARFSADPTPAAAFLQQAAFQAGIIYGASFSPPDEMACAEFLSQSFSTPQEFVSAIRSWFESMLQ